MVVGSSEQSAPLPPPSIHQAGEKAKKRKALLVSNKRRNERERVEYLDR